MLILIFAAEAIFLLPFVVVRIFRPTFLDVFEITNFQLGIAFSVYGTVAMISYFLGGPLADRYSARKLMTIALVVTSIGGIFFGLVPSLDIMIILYGFWGVSTILLFWAALIRATREWGGSSFQGRAYGFLDGGRGIVAALIASVSVAIFASLLPTDVVSASMEERESALGIIIWGFTSLTFLMAFIVWVFVPGSKTILPSLNKSASSLTALWTIIKMPAIWLIATIVICAYVGYKVTDDISLYARDALGYNDVDAASLATLSFWIRPIAALSAGLLADRFHSSSMMIVSFFILAIGSAFMASGYLQPGMHALIVLTIATTSLGIYALRGVYFALLHEAKVPLLYTGTAVGVVSVLGYTPDIFMGPLMGHLIDRSPGSLGHQHVFALLAGFAVVGLLATLLFRKVVRSENNEETTVS